MPQQKKGRASRDASTAKGKPDHEDEIPVSLNKNTNNSVEENQESDLENEENDSDDSDEDSGSSDCSLLSDLEDYNQNPKQNLYEKLEDYVNKSFPEIENCDPTTDDVIYSIKRLEKLTSECNCRENMKHLKYLGYYLNELEFVELLNEWMKLPRNTGIILEENIHPCIKVLADVTEASVMVCKSVVKLKLHKILIKDLSELAPELKEVEETEANRSSEDGLDPRWTVTGLFLVLYNVLRNYPPSRVEFREDGVVDVCMQYLKGEDLKIKTLALISISFAADLDKSSELIQATLESLLFLFKEIEGSIRCEQHRGLSGFNLDELMNGFSQLAKNRNNAIKMTRMGILKTCMAALEKKFDDAEIKWTLHLVWSLCFVDEIKKEILDCKILEKVSSYVDSSIQGIAEAARGIIWELGQTKESENVLVADEIEEGNSEVEQHIMISYCWKQQELAKKIFNRLKRCGKKAWLDIDGQMEGDSLEKMAEAVENSSFVICCFSEDYKNSQNCQSEARYAYKQKKNIVFAKMEPRYEPNGWLGILLGSNVYYNLYDAERFDNEITNMINYINKKSLARAT